MVAFMSYADGGTVTHTSEADVEISNLSFLNTTVVAVVVQSCTNVYIHDLDFDGCVGCIYLLDCNGQIRIEDIRSRGTGNGTIGSGHSNIIQLNNCTDDGSGGIRRNNIYGGDTEDMISIFQSGGADAFNPLIIEDNHLESPLPSNPYAWSSGSGSGMMLGDGGGSFILCRNNTLLNCGQVGIGIPQGDHVVVTNNVLYGAQRVNNNIGIYTPFTGTAYTGNNEVSANRIFWKKEDGSAGTIFDGGTSGTVAGLSPQTNTLQDATIDPADLAVDLSGSGGGTSIPAGADNAPAPTGTTSNISAGASAATIQSAINGAASGTTLVFPSATYNITFQVSLKTGVSLYGEPGATFVASQPADDNVLDATSVSDITISGIVFDGSGSGGGLNAAIAVLGSDNIHIQWNTFQNNFNQSDMLMFNSDNVYFQKNLCGPNEIQPVSMHHTDTGVSHHNVYVTDNVITEYSRMAIEALFCVQGEYHVDRNDISGAVIPHDSDGGIAISLVEDYGQVGPGVPNQHGTIWGNTIDTPEVGIECGLENMSIEENIITAGTAFLVGHQPGGVFERNTITSANPYQEDGGYNGTEWIGTNTVNGSLLTGWADHGPYGTRPTVYAASVSPDGAAPEPPPDPPPDPPPPAPGPNVTSISVHSGPVGGGTVVEITGTAFTGTTVVKFGATSAASFTVDSSTSITAVAPVHAPGLVDIIVFTPDGTSGPSTADHFTFTNVPSVTDISPNTGIIDGGETITIIGSGFTAATAVIFGSTGADFTVDSDTQITATSPSHITQVVNVRVVTPTGTSPTSTTNRFTYGTPSTGGGGGGIGGGGGVVGTDVVRWTFLDPVDGSTDEMVINPSGGGTPGWQRSIPVQNRLADSDKVLVYANADNPQELSFEGTIVDESQWDQIVNWFNKTTPIDITDDLGRTFTIIFTSFDAKRAWKANAPWYHTYDAKALIVNAPDIPVPL